MSSHDNFNNQQNQGSSKRSFTDTIKNSHDINKLLKFTCEEDFIQQMQAQTGIGKILILCHRVGENSQVILHTSVDKINSKVTVETLSYNDGKHRLSKFYQLKIDDTVIVNGFYSSIAEAKKMLFDLALVELQKVCFTIVKKRYPRELPKVKFSSAFESQRTSALSGIEEKIMKKMEWSGKGLGSQEQGCTDIVNSHFYVNRQGLENNNITQEVVEVLEKYSASQDCNSIAFSSDFTKDERTVIQTIAKKFHLRTRSYGKNENRFIMVENKIKPWNLIYQLLEAGKETEQYKLIVPTNFIL